MNDVNLRGAIAGDVAGSRFERSVWRGDCLATAACVGFDERAAAFPDSIGQQAESFELLHTDCFVTDDTLMMVAVMDWLLSGGELRDHLKSHFRSAKNPELFGKYFRKWAANDDQGRCGSVGNGAAMRVAPVAFARENLSEVRALARASAAVTHEVEHAIAGAEVIAAAVFLARRGESKQSLRDYLFCEFDLDFDMDLDAIRDDYQFSSDCRKTVPVSVAAFLQSDNLEQTLRRAISVGGDTDTIACMAGAIAGCFWGVDDSIRKNVLGYIDARSEAVLSEFEKRFPPSASSS